MITPVREYDLIADWYANEGIGRTSGVREALDAVSALPRGARILDAGCGNGLPITKSLVDAGYCAVGIDSSPAMLARFRTNLPAVPVVRGDVRHAPFAEDVFDGAIAWGVIFHLRPPDQARAFEGISRALKPGAPFLFTSAEVEDGTDDAEGLPRTMNGVTFHYWAVPSYRPLLARYAMELVDFFEDSGKNGYFLARKITGSL